MNVDEHGPGRAPKPELRYPVLQTERLVMLLPTADAASCVLRYFQRNREHLAASSPTRPRGFFTEAYWHSRLTNNRREFSKGTSLRLFLFGRNDPEGEVLGACSFTEVIRGPLQSCFLGYGLDRTSVGQGIMYEALQTAIRYVLDELGLHRICANYVPTNERSGRLLRRLGFVIEGYARDYVALNGAWRDNILTALLNPAAPAP